ncbi:MAG: hypothetical protein AAF434_08405 [Pseudomonadota bacterium]
MNIYTKITSSLALVLVAASSHAIEYKQTPYPIVKPDSFGLIETNQELVVCFDTEKGPLCGELNMAAFNLCQISSNNSMVCPDT